MFLLLEMEESFFSGAFGGGRSARALYEPLRGHFPSGRGGAQTVRGFLPLLSDS